jgi:hypothetical protein
MKIMNKKFITLFVSICVVVAGFFSALSVAYAATPTITSAKITGSNTVTIIYSEPVVTSLGDYSSFYDALSGRNLTAISGTGSNTVILTFDGSTFASAANGGIMVATNTVSVSDGSSFTAGYITITDGQTPVLSYVTVSSNNTNNAFAKIGNVITLTFSFNEQVSNPSVTIAGYAVGVSGSGSGPYTSTYTMASGDTEGSVPIMITVVDLANNTGKTTIIFSSGVTPTVASITSNAASGGILKIGDSIVFTLTPTIIQPNATISGSYNGIPLSWTTSNSGATYTATYTITSGNTDQTYPIQISGVIITDAAGHTSASVSGLDVVKTIDAHASVIYETTAVPTLTNTVSPSYTLTSSEAGTIIYGGSCSGLNSSVSAGINTITFNNLSSGLHSNCTITVIDTAGNVSNQITVSSFTVQTTTSSGTASYKFLSPLSVGSRGTDVTELQKRLTTEGVYSGPITGYFGSLTKTAVQKYQAIHGLSQLGNVGPATRALLNK